MNVARYAASALVCVSAVAGGMTAATAKSPTPTPTTTTPTRQAAQTAPVTATKSQRFKVVSLRAGAVLNVRSAAGTNKTRIGHLIAGTVVTATGKTASVGRQTWREIVFGSGNGWVSAAFLAKA
jgi:uncharacterized protein YraI